MSVSRNRSQVCHFQAPSQSWYSGNMPPWKQKRMQQCSKDENSYTKEFKLDSTEESSNLCKGIWWHNPECGITVVKAIWLTGSEEKMLPLDHNQSHCVNDFHIKVYPFPKFHKNSCTAFSILLIRDWHTSRLIQPITLSPSLVKWLTRPQIQYYCSQGNSTTNL